MHSIAIILSDSVRPRRRIRGHVPSRRNTHLGRLHRAGPVHWLQPGGETPEGIQDYILHIVATEEGHTAHGHDPRFKSFLVRAQKLQPRQPLVWFGDPIFERKAW